MKEEPEIIKQLRREEQLKQSREEINGTHETMQIMEKERLIRELDDEMQTTTSQDSEITTDNPVITTNETSNHNKLREVSNFSNTSNFVLEPAPSPLQTVRYLNENEIETRNTLLDDIDETIIELVKVNPLVTHSAIARALGCSHTAIKYRMYLLYRKGFLPGYRIKRKKQY